MKSYISHVLVQLGLVLHFILILCIAGLFMFDYLEAASKLTDINTICVGFYWLISMHKNSKLISNISFTGIAIALLFVQLINFNYAPALFINIGVLIVYFTFLLWQKDYVNARVVACIFAIPVFFTLLNMLSTQNFAFNTYARNAWDAAYIAAGIWLIAKTNANGISKYGAKLIFFSLFIYTLLLIQFPISTAAILKPIYLLGINFSGTTIVSTPHLSIYTAAAFLLAIYFLVKSSWRLKVLTLPILISLFLFILYTSWRPVWLGIIIGLGVSILLCYKQQRKFIISGFILMQVILFASNVGHFRDRMFNLVTQHASEERTIIWQDAWKMQVASPAQQWLIGHGLMSFKEDFKLYSRFYLNPELISLPPPRDRKYWVYNQTVNDYLIHFRLYSNYVKLKKTDSLLNKSINFRSPHNLLLDVLYTSGLLGLIFIGGFYYFMMRYLTRLSHFSNESRLLACVTLSALLSNLIVNGLNFPFFLHFNIMPIAFICGITLYLHESSRQSA
jgi:O-antigen ligase